MNSRHHESINTCECGQPCSGRYCRRCWRKRAGPSTPNTETMAELDAVEAAQRPTMPGRASERGEGEYCVPVDIPIRRIVARKRWNGQVM